MKPFAAALFAVAAAFAADAQDIRWHETYRAAMDEAQRTDKPLLVAFRCVP